MRRFGLLRNAVLVRGEDTMIAESVAQTHTIRMGSDRLSIITAGLLVPSAVWQYDGRALNVIGCLSPRRRRLQGQVDLGIAEEARCKIQRVRWQFPTMDHHVFEPGRSMIDTAPCTFFMR